MTETKYVHFRKEVIPVTKGADGFWRDPSGTLWAYADDSLSVDADTRCGVGPLSVPNWTGWMRQLNEACGVHDYETSSPVYEAFHSEAEAVRSLKESIRAAAGGAWWGALARPFRFLAQVGDRLFAWDNDDTL